MEEHIILSKYSMPELVAATREIELTLEESIRGLEIILCESGDKESTIHRGYVYEKLQRVRNGTMNFHPMVKVTILLSRPGIEKEIEELLNKR